MKVLICDDDSTSRHFVVEALKMSNCEVVEAETGEQAIMLAKLEKPEIVLIDHQMPEINGYDAVKIIRQEPGLENLPFVMITGNYEIQGMQEQDKMAHCAFLPKPYTVDQLIATIEIALDKPFP